MPRNNILMQQLFSKINIKTEPRLADKKQSTYFPTAQCWKLIAILNSSHFPYKAARVQLFKKIDFFFYINNKNLVTDIIKPNAGQSLLL